MHLAVSERHKLHHGADQSDSSRSHSMAETSYDVFHKSNVSKMVCLCEDLFACKQGSRSLQAYYGSIEAIFTNLAVYQPPSTDIETLTCYKD